MKLTVKVDTEFLYNNENIIEKKYNTPYSNYIILNNNEKGQTDYHSIILDSSRKILSFAPHKPIETSIEFSFENNNLYVSEYIEGTFIHLFYDINIDSWEIATKRAIGGNYFFYRAPDKYSLTYRQMFMEACGLEKDSIINDIPFLNDLNPNNCYGFVLQHPENHIVMNILIPKLYLVSIYEIDNINSNVTFISPEIYTKNPLFGKNDIYFPRTYDLQKYPVHEYIKTHSSIHTPLIAMGIMITDLYNNQSYSVINPNYKELAELRGNYPNIQYQYLCLNRIGKMEAFLNYFPQYTLDFSRYSKQYNTFITNVHQSYLSYYVKKEGVVISPKYFPTIYDIHHSIFIPSMANKDKIIIRRQVVKEYIDKMNPAKILFLLNYDDHFSVYGKKSDLWEKIEESGI